MGCHHRQITNRIYNLVQPREKQVLHHHTLRERVEAYWLKPGSTGWRGLLPEGGFQLQLILHYRLMSKPFYCTTLYGN